MRYGPNDENPSGLSWGLWVYRYFEPKDWPKQLLKVPEEFRPVAEQYLRDMADRLRVVRKLKQQEFEK